MTVLMFWNTGRRATPGAIASLCSENDVDVLVLAECELSASSVTGRIGPTRPSRLREIVAPVAGAVRFFSRVPTRFWIPILDHPRYTIRHLTPPIGLPLLIVGVHLPSKLHASDSDQEYVARGLREDIGRCEEKVGHQNTVVVGDFNLDPFEDAMTAADGLHAMMDKGIAQQGNRTFRGRSWDFFYNPMWSLMGDESPGPPATYYRSSSALVARFWYMFDQILLRPGLLGRYRPGAVKVVRDIGGAPILPREAGRDAHSDHLPVMISLDIEMEAGNA
jgi:hypothetical protein